MKRLDHRGRVLAIVAGHWVHDTYTAFLPPLLPLLVPAFSLSTTEAGLLAVLLQTPWLIQPWLGRLADRGYARRFVVLAPTLTGTMMCLAGRAPSYGVLALLMLGAGVGSAAIHASAPALMGLLSGRRLGRGMGLWMVGGEAGRTLGPVLLVATVGLLGLRGLPWLILVGVAASVLLHFALRDAPRATGGGDGEPVGRVLRRMLPLLLPLTGIMLARNCLAVAMTVYLPLFLHREGAALWLAGISLALVEGAGVAGALAGGVLSDRWGRRWVIALALVLTPAAMLLFLVSPLWARLPLLLLAGFVGLSTTPVLMALIQEREPDHRALANGIYMVLNYVVRSSALLTMGLASDLLGGRQAMAFAALAALAGLPLLRFLPVKRNL